MFAVVLLLGSQAPLVFWWKKRLERGWSVDQFEPRLSDSVGLKECQVKSEKNPSVSEKNCTSFTVYRWYINPIISLLNVVQKLQVVKFSIVPYGSPQTRGVHQMMRFQVGWCKRTKRTWGVASRAWEVDKKHNNIILYPRYIYIYGYIYMGVYIHIYYKYIYIHICICIYIYVYVYVYIYMYIILIYIYNMGVMCAIRVHI